MNFSNENKFNEYVVDIELLRYEMLIDEREEYEEEFFSLELSDDEFNNMILQYNPEIDILLDDFEDEIVDPFEYEDYLNQLRDEKLIEEREIFELSYFEIIDENSDLNNHYDFQIENFNQEELFEWDFDDKAYEDYEYDQYEEEMFYYLLYLKESQFQSQSNCRCEYLDYMPNDDGFCDYLDCYDYPESPNENLSGIIYY